jgi:hypothetical protein
MLNEKKESTNNKYEQINDDFDTDDVQEQLKNLGYMS